MFNIKKTAIGVAAFAVLTTSLFLAPSGINADGGSLDNGTEIAGAVTGYFTEISGLGSEHDLVEYQDGDDLFLFHKRPGRAKYSDITLKRGYLTTADTW